MVDPACSRGPQQDADAFGALARQLIRLANRGGTRLDMLRGCAELVRAFAAADEVELWLDEAGRRSRLRAFRRDGEPACEILADEAAAGDLPLHRLLDAVLRGGYGDDALVEPLWFPDTRSPGALPEAVAAALGRTEVVVDGPYRTVAVFPFGVDDARCGVIALKRNDAAAAIGGQLGPYRGIAESLGIAIVAHLARTALQERVKEMTCLYEVARIVERPDTPIAEMLQAVVEQLPRAFMYPAIAAARIRCAGGEATTIGWQDAAAACMRVPLAAPCGEQGCLEVCYREGRPELDEGPFLAEERRLLETVAQDVAQAVEHRLNAAAREALESQLRHADRLATLGQLAAGVAHEINEPLNTVLGFGQLLQKEPGLTAGQQADLGHIVDAALHARKVIRKLMLFAREAPAEMRAVDLIDLVEESLFFFEARCQKSGIELVRTLDPATPKVRGDLPQLKQVLINLIVNAMQAITGRGRITVAVQPGADGRSAELHVTDTGVGMTAEVQARIFLPFFTTKGVHEGTGLGLSVVHGILTAHRATIRVDSGPGRGARFVIVLPALDRPDAGAASGALPPAESHG